MLWCTIGAIIGKILLELKLIKLLQIVVERVLSIYYQEKIINNNKPVAMLNRHKSLFWTQAELST